MPTPIPAKPRTSDWPTLAVLVLAVGLAVYLLRAERPAAGERATSTSNAGPPPAADVERRDAPSTEPVTDPNAVAQNVARALPRGERETQRLKLLEVQALVQNGQIGSARAKTRDYFERWPNGPDIAALEQLTGAHPTGDAPQR